MTEARSKPGRFGDLRVRVVSGLVMGIFCLVCAIAGGVAATVLAVFLLWLLLWEYHRIVTGSPRLSAPALIVLQIGAGLAAIALGAGAVALSFGLFVAASLAAGLLARAHFAVLALGALYIGAAIGALLHLRLHVSGGFALLVWIVCVVIASDVFAYFTGRSIGGAKLCPSISPGKTRSGGAGGLVGAVLFSLVFALALGWPAVPAALAGLMIAVASQCGDLGESWMKRRAGVKDSGVLIPGHGGFLDRLDGVLGGTWVFLILNAFGLGSHLVS
jgi:phosphatidate cytidylyltransferase